MSNEFIEAVLKREKSFEDLGSKKIVELIDSGKLINIFLTGDEIFDLEIALECYGEEMMNHLSEKEIMQLNRLRTIIQGYLVIMMIKSQEYQKKYKGGVKNGSRKTN